MCVMFVWKSLTISACHMSRIFQDYTGIEPAAWKVSRRQKNVPEVLHRVWSNHCATCHIKNRDESTWNFFDNYVFVLVLNDGWKMVCFLKIYKLKLKNIWFINNWTNVNQWSMHYISRDHPSWLCEQYCRPQTADFVHSIDQSDFQNRWKFTKL